MNKHFSNVASHHSASTLTHFSVLSIIFHVSSSSFTQGIHLTLTDPTNNDLFFNAGESTRISVQQASNALSTTSKALLTLSELTESEYWNPSIYDDLAKCKQNQANKLGMVFEPEYLLGMIQDMGLAFGYNYATNVAMDGVYKSLVSCLEVTNFNDHNLRYSAFENCDG